LSDACGTTRQASEVTSPPSCLTTDNYGIRVASDRRPNGVVVRGYFAHLLLAALILVGCSGAPTTQAVVSTSAPVQSIGVGSCSPAVAFAGHVVDCRFPVDADAAAVDEIHGKAVAVLQFGGDVGDLSIRSWPCLVEGDELVCRRLVVQEQVSSVGVDFGSGHVVWDLAELVVADASILQAWVRIPQLDVSPGLFAGVATQVDVFRTSGDAAVWGLVSRWPERELVDTVGLLSADEPHASVSVTIVETGVYELTMCEGADPAVCVPAPSGLRFQVLGGAPVELIPGHNELAGDRINIVVTGGGFGSVDEFIWAARMLMAPGAGPILVCDVGPCVDGTPRSVWFPPFAIDPLREMADRVNVWYLPDPVDYSGPDRGWLTEGEWADIPIEFGALTDVAFVHLVAAPYGVDVLEKGVDAGGGAASFASFRGSLEPPASQQEARFGLATVTLEPERPWRTTNTLVHELGHSLFGLEEEYFLQGQGEPHSDCEEGFAPHRAGDLAEAQMWWGDLVGQVDPFFIEYRDTLVSYGLWEAKERFEFEKALSVGFFPAGCGFKPTGYSIMSWTHPDQGAIPVFGSVNRLRASQILKLWTGTN
jgi:hypothetical protein